MIFLLQWGEIADKVPSEKTEPCLELGQHDEEVLGGGAAVHVQQQLCRQRAILPTTPADQ